MADEDYTEEFVALRLKTLRGDLTQQEAAAKQQRDSSGTPAGPGRRARSELFLTVPPARFSPG